MNAILFCKDQIRDSDYLIVPDDCEIVNMTSIIDDKTETKSYLLTNIINETAFFKEYPVKTDYLTFL